MQRAENVERARLGLVNVRRQELVVARVARVVVARLEASLKCRLRNVAVARATDTRRIANERRRVRAQLVKV